MRASFFGAVVVAGLLGIGCGGDPGTGLPEPNGPFGTNGTQTTCAPAGGIRVQSLGADPVCPPGTTPVTTPGTNAPSGGLPGDSASTPPSGGSSDGDGDGDDQKEKGNNGVGNGQDPQPPGDPPVNDGPGTSPGDPGNKGG